MKQRWREWQDGECGGGEVDEKSTAHGGAVIHESRGKGVSHTPFTAELPSTNTQSTQFNHIHQQTLFILVQSPCSMVAPT